jgi:hypothetical protein
MSKYLLRRLVANAAIIQRGFLMPVVIRNRSNAIRTMAEQTIIPPFERVGNARPFWLLFRRDRFRLLGPGVAEDTDIGGAIHVIFRIRMDCLQTVTFKAPVLLTFEQVRDRRHRGGRVSAVVYQGGFVA